MSEGALALITPLNWTTVLHGLYDFALPLTLYCVWSTLAFLDLAGADQSDRRKVWGWSAAILLLPFVGSAAYLLMRGSRAGRAARLTVVLGGGGAMLVAFGFTYLLIRP